MRNLTKKLSYAIYIVLAVVMASCGYQKDPEVRRNSVTGEMEYVIWVRDGIDIIASYRLPIDSVTYEKIDSLNLLADEFILLVDDLNNYR